MFPTTARVDAGGIGELLQTGDFLRRQHDVGSFGSLYDMALLRGSDDGHGAFGNSPGDANLRARGTILLSDRLHLAGQNLQLWQHGIVLLAAVALCRQRILLAVFTREGALLQHHVSPELDAVLPAVVEHATFL